MSFYELLPRNSTPTKRGAIPLYWHRFGDTSTLDVHSSFSWDMHELGKPSTSAADLLRIASGAYLADRLTVRGQFFSRDMHILVHVVDASSWPKDVLYKIESLLSWLTGDVWSITVRQSKTTAKPNALDLPIEAMDEVTLLSGGLDSLCGGIDRIDDGKRRLFIGHNDGTAVVQKAQNNVHQFMHNLNLGTTAGFQSLIFSNVGKKAEASTRSRSLLFMSLATAMATSTGAGTVIVPENGYTSLNVPLNAARGGALSTRSTHPTTFDRINHILNDIGISVSISNPYQSFTKGEFVKIAHKKLGSQFVDFIPQTISCGKLDGTYFKGGNPNWGCGLCIPCIVRRSSIGAAGIADTTPYLSANLTGDALLKLHAARKLDIYAVQDLLLHPRIIDDVVATGPWPDDFDISAAYDLHERAMGEIAALSIP